MAPKIDPSSHEKAAVDPVRAMFFSTDILGRKTSLAPFWLLGCRRSLASSARAKPARRPAAARSPCTRAAPPRIADRGVYPLACRWKEGGADRLDRGCGRYRLQSDVHPRPLERLAPPTRTVRRRRTVPTTDGARLVHRVPLALRTQATLMSGIVRWYDLQVNSLHHDSAELLRRSARRACPPSAHTPAHTIVSYRVGG